MTLSQESIIAVLRASELRRQYFAEKMTIRLGQFLLCEMAPDMTCPEVFYEEDPNTAFDEFLKRVLLVDPSSLDTDNS